MRTLSRYFAARFFSLFAATLFVSMLAIVIVEMLLNFDNILETWDGIPGLLRYFLLRIPSYYLGDLVPVATCTASFLCLGLAGRWLEISAIKAGGISPYRVALPVLGAAAVVALAALAVNETWGVESTRQTRRPQSEGGGQLTFHQGSFWYHRGRVIYSVTKAERSTRSLRGLRLYERDPLGRVVRIIQADKARVEDDHQWRLEHATIRRFDPLRPEQGPSLEILAETTLPISDASEDVLLDADPSTLSLGKLRRYIAARRLEGDPAHGAIALFHTRLTEPLSVVLLATLAVPFGLMVEHSRSFGRPALLTIVVLVSFFAARSVGISLGAGGLVPAASGPWSPLLIFSALAASLLARIPR